MTHSVPRRRSSFLFLSDESGQGTVEYAVIALITILVACAAIDLFKEALARSFERTSSVRAGMPGIYP